MILTEEDFLEILQQQDEFKKEERFSKEVATEIFPHLGEINKEDLVDHDKLKNKLDFIFSKKIKKNFLKFKDIIFGIFQTSFLKISGGFLILNQIKLFGLMKDKISSKEIIELIRKTPNYITNPLCSLVNIINESKFNFPDRAIQNLMVEKISKNLQNQK
jgi:hypothetical protein